MRSDLRLFSSDNNATIKDMSSPKAFREICYLTFEKMLNTVPSKVKLSDVIVPRTWTLQEIHLDLSKNGVLTVQGNITSVFKDKTPPITASYTYDTNGISGKVRPRKSMVGCKYGSTYRIEITLTLNIVTYFKPGIGNVTTYAFNDHFSRIEISALAGINIHGLPPYTTAINRDLFILDSRSFKKINNLTNGGQQILVRAAVSVNSFLTHYIPRALPISSL